MEYEFKVTLPEEAKNKIKEMRDDGKLKGNVIIDETGIPSITVECSEKNDALFLKIKF